MEFCDFAQMLMPVIGEGASIPDFTRTLFDSMVNDGGKEIVTCANSETLKKYYSGDVGIGRFARKIGTHLEPGEFATYIEGFDDSATIRLVETFANSIEGLTKQNVGEKLAELFESILVEASQSKGRRSMKTHAEDDRSDAVYEAEPIADPHEATDRLPCIHQTTIVQNGDRCAVITGNDTVNVSL